MIIPMRVVGAIPIAAAAWQDARKREIPDTAVLLLFLCAVLNVFLGGLSFREAAISCLLLGLIGLLLALLTNGIGGGDVKLCAAAGAMLGLHAWLVTAFALFGLILYGRIRRAGALPLAPFLLCSYLILIGVG